MHCSAKVDVWLMSARYGRILERIIGPTIQPQSRSNTAKRLLGWLACAKRPLYWYEIQGAVSLDLEEGVVCPDMRFEVDCKDLCASLVDRSSDGSVVLVHTTAKKYVFFLVGFHLLILKVLD